jgi:hypothetical protein
MTESGKKLCLHIAVINLPLMSNFNSTFKYEVDVEHSVVSLIFSSVGYIEWTSEWKRFLLTDKTLSI